MAKNLEYYDEIDSTNNRAKHLARPEVQMELFLLRRRRRREKEDAADAGNHRRAAVFPCRFC